MPMKLLLQLMLCAIAIVIASAQPCAAAPQSRGGTGYVTSLDKQGDKSFTTNELNSPMMQESKHEVAAADGENHGSAGSQSLLGRGWSLVKEYPVTSLFVLCLVLWLLFSCIIKGMRRWV